MPGVVVPGVVVPGVVVPGVVVPGAVPGAVPGVVVPGVVVPGAVPGSVVYGSTGSGVVRSTGSSWRHEFRAIAEAAANVVIR